MPRTGVRFRFVTLLLAALQLAMPGLASLADAAAARESRSTYGVTHVEEPGGAQCPPVHTDECALCQFLSAPTLLAARGGDVLAVSTPPSRGRTDEAVLRDRLERGTLGARAPPAV